MKGHFNSYMKVGIVHPMAYPSAGNCNDLMMETIQRIAEDEFFGAIEITHIEDASVREKIRKMLDISGISVVYGAQPIILGEGLDLNHGDNGKRKKAITRLKGCIDEACELGAKAVVLLSGKCPNEAQQKDEAIRLLIDSLNQLCSHALKKGGINIVLEQFDFDIEKYALIGLAKDARFVAESVRKEFLNFGLLVDLGHLPLIREDTGETLRLLAEYLVSVHIGNCVLADTTHPAHGDKHPRFGIKGGEVTNDCLAKFLRLLFEVGFLKARSTNLPIVSYEVKPLPGEDPELIIANSKRALIEAWAKCE